MDDREHLEYTSEGLGIFVVGTIRCHLKMNPPPVTLQLVSSHLFIFINNGGGPHCTLLQVALVGSGKINFTVFSLGVDGLSGLNKSLSVRKVLVKGGSKGRGRDS